MKHIAFNVAVIIFCIAPSLAAQDTEGIDLLKRIDTSANAVIGKWERSPQGIAATAEPARAICEIPYDLAANYRLDFEFTRETGSDVVGIVLPLGKTQVFLELSGWEGEVHGLSRIGGSTKQESNPTSTSPGTLENGKKYQARVEVESSGEDVSIEVVLNGKELIDWSGVFADIEPNIVFRTKSNQRLALATGESNTTFHKAILFPKMASQPKTVATQTAGPIELTKVDWSEKLGQISVVDFQGEDVIQTKGMDDTVAFLPGLQLADGTIEIEIASDIFSGIAVRGVDTANYDLIYFRPQNSGTAKHEYSVQYVCKGKPNADWRTLREKFPGKYEAGADMKVNQWFHVRIQLEGRQLKCFVDRSAEPVLVVDSMLGDQPTGKVGIWGWDSHFRNLRVTPSKKQSNESNSNN